MAIDVSNRPRPWFSEPMAWFVFALPASVVVAGVVTAVIAWRGADGAVADDTYRQGLAINEQLARSARARELGIEAEVIGGSGESGSDAVVVRLRARAPLPEDGALELRWVHPGRSGADRHARVVRTRLAADGRAADYAGRRTAGEPTAAGTPWRVVLAGKSWRLDGDAGPRADAERDGTEAAATLVLRPPQ